VGLIVEIQAVIDQFFEVDILGEIETSAAWAGTAIAAGTIARGAAFAALSFSFARATFAAFAATRSRITLATARASALTGRPAAFTRRACFAGRTILPRRTIRRP
jgi:hypothetical protein